MQYNHAMKNPNEKIIFIAFTSRALNLAERISKFFPECEIHKPENLHEFVREIFPEARAIIFISACGIAVRAIAPFVKSKLSDPAVLVIGESGEFVIPILSGHIGGANSLARKISGLIHAQAVITTATDVNNIIAIDEWAVKNNCEIENPELIKRISAELLRGNSQSSQSSQSIGVAITEQLQITPWQETLVLRPKNLVLGAGCKKNLAPEEFEIAAKNFLESAGVSELSLRALATINIKSHEPALLNFAEKRNLEFFTFSSQELMQLDGREYFLASSARVLELTGTDNVCERAAILCAKNLACKNAALLRSKAIFSEGVTLALSRFF